jgi:hypothetical protein
MMTVPGVRLNPISSASPYAAQRIVVDQPQQVATFSSSLDFDDSPTADRLVDGDHEHRDVVRHFRRDCQVQRCVFEALDAQLRTKSRRSWLARPSRARHARRGNPPDAA